MLRTALGDSADSTGGRARPNLDAILSAVLELANASDEDFHRQSAESLATGLGCDTAFIGELFQDGGVDTVRTLAVWSRGKPSANFEYPLAGTPCEDVFKAGFLQVDADVAGRYPRDQMLVDINAESYVGVSLVNAEGKPVGHIAALDRQPMGDVASAEKILRIVGARAEAVLGRRAVEHRLRNIEDNFQLLFEQSPNAIVLFDPDTWKPIEFNDLAPEFMGYTRSEFAKLTITDLELEPNPEETREHIERILVSGGDVFEGLHKAKDGSPRNVIVSLRTTRWKGRTVMLTLWHDITARKTAEQALEASERRLESILDTAMDALVIVNGEGHIVRLNQAAERVFKCRAADVLGAPIQGFFPGPTLSKLLSQVAREGQLDGSGSIWAPQGLNALRSDADVFPVELTLSWFQIDGAPFYTLILRDVNDRVRAEGQLRGLQEDKRLLQEQLSENTTIVGGSPALLEAFSHVDKVATTDSTVLILGETGTGKELVARAIHDKSVRRERVMVTVNCAALPKDLLESELFGHEKGAFTGATQRRRGRFELANGGTLFLDEVGELSLDAQAKLLRALQEGEIQRVGGESTVRVNVRVIAATHQNLRFAVEEGRFRSDLYYRLSVFPLRLPPLRERGADIALLADHFVSIFARRFGKHLSGFDDDSLRRLMAYEWPGNVRELQNVIERAAILSGGGKLTLEGGLLAGPSVSQAPERPQLSNDDGLDDVTRRHMERVLEECRWVVAGPHGAAKRLDMNPSTLRFRMKKLGIQRPPTGT